MVGSTTYKVGQSSPIKLVFWVELDRGLGWLGSGGPRPGRALARGYSKPGRILLRTLIVARIIYLFVSLLFALIMTGTKDYIERDLHDDMKDNKDHITAATSTHGAPLHSFIPSNL